MASATMWALLKINVEIMTDLRKFIIVFVPFIVLIFLVFMLIGIFHEEYLKDKGRREASAMRTENSLEDEIIETREFSEGLACVRTSSGWGYINEKGVLVIKPQFRWAQGFEEGMARVMVGNSLPSSRYGYIDRTGNWVIDPNQFDYVDNFKDGLAKVKIKIAGRDMFGFIDRSGKFVIEAQYLEAYDFKDGLARAKAESGKWGYIDKAGKWFIEAQYDWVKDFEDGRAEVSLNSRRGYIDMDGGWTEWTPAADVP